MRARLPLQAHNGRGVTVDSRRDRREYRDRLERDAEKWPGDWAADFVARFGMAGAVELLMAQGGDPFVDLTVRPFAGNRALKDAVRNARRAVSEMRRVAYVAAAWDAEKSKRERT